LVKIKASEELAKNSQAAMPVSFQARTLKLFANQCMAGKRNYQKEKSWPSDITDILVSTSLT